MATINFPVPSHPVPFRPEPNFSFLARLEMVDLWSEKVNATPLIIALKMYLIGNTTIALCLITCPHKCLLTTEDKMRTVGIISQPVAGVSYWLALVMTKILGFQSTTKNRGPPYPPHYDSFRRTRGVFSKVVLGFRNFAWDPK